MKLGELLSLKNATDMRLLVPANLQNVSSELNNLNTEIKLPATNLTNVDFKSGTIAPSTLRYADTVSLVGDELTFIATYRYGKLIAPKFDCIPGNIYYFAVWVKTTSPVVRIELYTKTPVAAAKYHTGSGEYELLSTISVGGTEATIHASVMDPRISGWDNISVKALALLNLTDIFGEGNEPTAPQMDDILSFYPNSWFCSTVNLANNTKILPYLLKNMRVMDKELSDIKQAIILLGGTV